MLNYDLTFQVSEPKTIIKRDGKVVSFDRDRILTALKKCFSYDDNFPYEDLVQQVINVVSGEQTTVEQIQNIVETVLMASGYHQQAKQYILFRNKRNEMRKNRPVPSSVQQAFSESDQYFPSEVQKFQFYNKYSRWNYDLGRRETWIETVDRSVSFLAELSGNNLEQEVYHDIRDGMLLMKAMPSMRLIATAGDAARRQNLSIYNCSYMAVDSIDSFVEALIISMAGCGVGFSVEKDYVEKLPRIMRQHGVKPIHHTIEDTSEGWADALRIALHTWFGGNDIVFNYSEIRPAGAILKIKGGQASGPEPLKTMLNFVRDRILRKQGGVLSTLDAHDIMCTIGNAAVSGGYRRTAMISLFDFDDEIMRHCKDGDFERMNSQRWNANNSSVWPERDLNQQEIAEHFLAMVKGQRGEPGIFSRKSAMLTLPDRRKPDRFGTNPCGEILLKPQQFCNLSISIARENDTEETLREKVRLSTIIGTIQSMATYFPGLRDEWRKNCEEERLLGVDITGQMDSLTARDPEVQARLKDYAIEVNREYANKLRINQSASVTCVKPSGNSSRLFDCSPGIHARWSEYYIANMRISAHSPIAKMLLDQGIPMSPENGQTIENVTTWVVHFPLKSPEGAITRHDLSAIQQCEYWLSVKQNYTEHNPSVTISYTDSEVLDVAKWIWQHQDYIGGMAFLPKSDALYAQMPYEEIDKATYDKLKENFPKIDFSKLYQYEEKDHTEAAQLLACMSGNCDV